MAGDKFPFPIISFQPFLTGSKAEQEALAKELYNAFHTYGWVYLKDFGISQEEINESFKYSESFFGLPMEDKMKMKVTSSTYSQGYTPDGVERLESGTSHKECYEHRRMDNTNCPPAGGEDGFREYADSFYQKCFKLAAQVLRALCMVLGIPDSFFDDKLEKADPQLRLLKYMALPKKTLDEPGNFRISPHTDYGLCTLLFQDQVGGLEVDPFHTGEFVQATPLPGTCIINVADLLQRLSNDKLRSTRHRVGKPMIAPEVLEKMGPDDMLPTRYSTVFFVHPDPAATITPIVAEGEAAKYAPVNAGKWRTHIHSSAYGLAVPKSEELGVPVERVY